MPIMQIGLVVVGYLRRIAKDETGASLSIALLLFLVCTIVASIVLVVGTTSSGRMADLAKMDQHYYNVTSAVELFRDQLREDGEDPTKCFIATETLSCETIEPEDEGDEAESYSITENEAVAVTTSTDSLTTLLGNHLVYGSGSSPVGKWSDTMVDEIDESDLYDWENIPVVAPSALEKSGSLELEIETSKFSTELGATVTATFNDDGSAKLVFQSNPVSEGDVTYKVQATLVPDFDIDTFMETHTDGTFTETKTVTMRWEIANVTSDRDVYGG